MNKEFDIEDMMNNIFGIAITKELENYKKEREKEQEEMKKYQKQFAEASKHFRDEMLKNGFSKEFTETLLLEIIKNTILKGEF